MLVPQVEASASGVLRAAGRNGKGEWHRWSSSKLLESGSFCRGIMHRIQHRCKVAPRVT